MLHILTLTWNGQDKITKLHDTLIPALEGIDYQWWIKDNASKDETVAVANTWGNKVHCIAYKDNRQNFSEGCNFLFNEAKPDDNDLIMLLNNDIIFNDTTSIKTMLDLIQKDKEIGMVGAHLCYTNTVKLQHAGVVFNPTYKTPMHFRAGQDSDNDAQRNREFQVVTGAVCVTRADLFRNANTNNKSGICGMDEKYHWAFDDVDLCLSIKYNLGKKIVYCGSTDIFHEESGSLKKNPVNKLFLTPNLQYMFGKWKGRYVIDQDIYTKDSRHNLYRGPNAN
jgi:GT2 family glycosyltransferase